MEDRSKDKGTRIGTICWVALVSWFLVMGTLGFLVYNIDLIKGSDKPTDSSCCVCKCHMEDCATDTITSL